MINQESNVSGAPLPLLQLEYALNIEKRFVYMEQQIDIATPTIIFERINALATLSKDDKTPITLVINNYGGSVHGMFGLYDLMRQVPMPINTIGTGAVMSAAVLILAGATGKRQVTANTTVMIHQVSTWMQGTVMDISTEAKQVKCLQDKLFELLDKSTNKDANYWKKKCTTNYYLTPAECKDLGLIDEII